MFVSKKTWTNHSSDKVLRFVQVCFETDKEKRYRKFKMSNQKQSLLDTRWHKLKRITSSNCIDMKIEMQLHKDF